MNELTRTCLDAAKATNGSVITKSDFLQVVKKVFSPDSELPPSLPNPHDFDNPCLSYEIRQDARTRWDANPFKVFIRWYGIDEEKGYVTVADHFFANGGTLTDLEEYLAKIQEAEYFLCRTEPEQTW